MELKIARLFSCSFSDSLSFSFLASHSVRVALSMLRPLGFSRAASHAISARLCRSPMHGIGVYGPRANPMDDGLLKHLVLDPETIYPKYPLPLYDPPDLPYPYQTLPDGAVDVRKVVGARRCPGVTDRRFENEVVQKYQAWKKASLNIPRIRCAVATGLAVV